MKRISAAILAVLAGAAVQAGDCSTDHAREKALVVFLEKHYGPVSVVGYPSDQGQGTGFLLMDLYFYPYEPQARDCEGVVRVTDDCRITDAGGAPLDSAGARERAFRCKLSSG